MVHFKCEGKIIWCVIISGSSVTSVHGLHNFPSNPSRFFFLRESRHVSGIERTEGEGEIKS